MPLPPLLRKNALVVAVALGLATVRMGVVLFVPPVVGLANNADFERVMARVGLGYLTDRYDERYWSWSLTKYAMFDPSPFRTQHLTTEVPLVWMAVQATRLVSRDSVFDIRVLGAVHAVLLLVALGLLLRACRDLAPAVQWIIAGLLVFVFTDVGYIAPFQSLYGQTSSLLALLWIAGISALAIRARTIGRWGLAVYFGAAAWFVGSKPQECLQAPFLALFGLRLGKLVEKRRLSALPWVFALGLLGLAVWVYHRVPRFEIHDVGLYHTVFMDLLPSSPDPAADLRSLGLDAALVRFSGLHAYLDGSPLGDPVFRAQFFHSFGYGGLIRFYLTHPGRLADRLRRAGAEAFRLRPPNLGNLDQASGAPRLYQYQHASTWSRWRLALGGFGLGWILILLGGNVLAAGLGWRSASARSRLFREGMILLACLAGLEFLVCCLADYLGDLPRHLYLFQAVFDLLLIADLGWAGETLLGWLGARGGRAARGSAWSPA